MFRRLKKTEFLSSLCFFFSVNFRRSKYKFQKKLYPIEDIDFVSSTASLTSILSFSSDKKLANVVQVYGTSSIEKRSAKELLKQFRHFQTSILNVFASIFCLPSYISFIGTIKNKDAISYHVGVKLVLSHQ